jgi:hypothetical protein
MATDKECEGYAHECVRLAGLTDDPEIREQLFQMAREWMAQAMHEEKMPKSWGPGTPGHCCRPFGLAGSDN